MQVFSAIGAFLLAMLLFPDVQKRVQEEIDSVVGSYRLPTTTDPGNMPYLAATFKEVLRWHSVAHISEI